MAKETKKSVHHCRNCKLCCGELSGSRFLTPEDIARVKEAGKENFYDKNSDFPFPTLKTNGGYCIFYDHENYRCSIYAHRPADCRFFPYDTLKKDGKYYWIKWKISGCIIHDLMNDEKALQDLERDVLPIFMPHFDVYTEYTNFMMQRENANDFKIIREIKFPNNKKPK